MLWKQWCENLLKAQDGEKTHTQTAFNTLQVHFFSEAISKSSDTLKQKAYKFIRYKEFKA